MEKMLKPHVPRRVSPERSRTMSKIRSAGNKSTEQRVRMLLVRNGIKGWQLQRSDLKGRPDFFFTEKKVVLFVDGCFWHGCPRCYRGTKTNKKFWQLKVASNKRRDRKNNRYYRAIGFRVVRIWEHQLERSEQILKHVA